MSKSERSEQRRDERENAKLEKQIFTFRQVQALVMQRDRLMQKRYSGLIDEVKKCGYESKCTDGVWTLEKIPTTNGLNSEAEWTSVIESNAKTYKEVF